MKKVFLFSILISLFLVSCSNLHFNDTTSVSMYLPELGGKSGANRARSISAAEIFDGQNYDTDVYFYEINLMQGDTVKYSKKSKGGKTVTFKYIRPGDYSVECFAKVQRNFNQTTFLSGYTEINIIKGRMAEAEVEMVNCPVITKQPTNSIYDPTFYTQGLNEYVNVDVKNSNNIIYEWYLDGKRISANGVSLSLISFDLNVNEMHTVNGIIYNCPERWKEGQPPSKKDGFVRIDTVHTYPFGESDYDEVKPVEIGCYFKDKAFSEFDKLYPEDFYMNIYTKKGTVTIPHLTNSFFVSVKDDGSFDLSRNDNQLTKSLYMQNNFTLRGSITDTFGSLFAEVKIGYEFNKNPINATSDYNYTDSLLYQEVPIGFTTYDVDPTGSIPAYIKEQDKNYSMNYQWYACDSSGHIICALDDKTTTYFDYDASIGYEYFKVKITITGLSEYVINADNGKIEYWSDLFYPGV